MEEDRLAKEKAVADAALEKKLAKKNARATAKKVTTEVKPADAKPVAAKKEEKKEGK